MLRSLCWKKRIEIDMKSGVFVGFDVNEERHECGRQRGLSLPTSLSLASFIPAPLAHAGLEMRRRCLNFLAYGFHGIANFIAICIHFSTLVLDLQITLKGGKEGHPQAFCKNTVLSANTRL
jgi:hypothetical protein